MSDRSEKIAVKCQLPVTLAWMPRFPTPRDGAAIFLFLLNSVEFNAELALLHEIAPSCIVLNCYVCLVGGVKMTSCWVGERLMPGGILPGVVPDDPFEAKELCGDVLIGERPG